MQEHRTAGAPSAPSQPSAPPAIGTVQAFGVVDALRVDLQRVQLPWLIAEIDELCASLERVRDRDRASYEELSDIAKRDRTRRAWQLEQEIERRAYQLETLGMIRGQLPVTPGASELGETPADSAATLLREPLSREPLSVVGPAVLITGLLGRSAYSVACALREA